MTVLPFKIPKPKNEALVYQEDQETFFYDKLHQHEEIQISLILKGSGTIIVGDSISSYNELDILVIGGNVPHVFRSDKKNEESLMYTLFFTSSSLGKEFFHITDLQETTKFFEKAEYGVKISGNKDLIEIFLRLQTENKIERIGSLLRIISLTIESKGQRLCSFVYKKKISNNEGKRIRAVYEHAIENFHEPISLDEISQKASMSKNAFCRYFKRHTNKTFFEFLTELRIANACKLLHQDKEMPISSIADLSGFQNIANFNRKFKELKGATPSEYRKRS